MRPEAIERRQQEVVGWLVRVVSYRLGDRFYCTVDNVDPGARIGTGEGATREEAEQRALEEATRALQLTRRLPPR